MKRKDSNRSVLRRQTRKKAWRKKRSSLKRKFVEILIHNGEFKGQSWRKYNLDSYYPSFSQWQYRIERASLGVEGKINKETKYPIQIPKIFCFQKNPDETIKFLETVHQLLFKLGVNNVSISHEKVEYLGLAASYLFDTKITEALAFFRRKGQDFHLSGNLNKEDKRINNYLLAYGLLKNLGIKPEELGSEYFDLDYEQKFVSFKFKGSQRNTTDKDHASTKLTNYFNNCLKHIGYEIQADAKADLSDAIAEIIDNAEEHSGNDEDWVALGCFDKDTSICNFAIINFGKSIYEALSDEKSTAKHVLEEIEKIVHSHKSILKKIGEKFSKKEEEPLWNVMALQEGISSKRTEDGDDRTRGQGLMDVLGFVAALKTSDPENRVSIISGHSSIIIDYSYNIFEREVGDQHQKVRTIAFNKKNSLHSPMDDTKVQYLDNKFRGTVLTGSLKLDKSKLDSITNNDG